MKPSARDVTILLGFGLGKLNDFYLINIKCHLILAIAVCLVLHYVGHYVFRHRRIQQGKNERVFKVN